MNETLITLLQTIGIMLLCSCGFLWARAVWTLARREDTFEWGVFFRENVNRYILTVSGCVIFGIIHTIDPVGLTSFFDAFGLLAFVGTRGAIGLGIGWFTTFFKIKGYE